MRKNWICFVMNEVFNRFSYDISSINLRHCSRSFWGARARFTFVTKPLTEVIANIEYKVKERIRDTHLYIFSRSNIVCIIHSYTYPKYRLIHIQNIDWFKCCVHFFFIWERFVHNICYKFVRFYDPNGIKYTMQTAHDCAANFTTALLSA